MNWCLQEGDCVELMQPLPAECVHSIVADPPYGLEFMGKEFDKLGHGRAQQEWHRRWAVEAFRIALPGAHVLAFGGTRTYHRLASALEDAGWEIRDSIHWTYGSGFPKSHSIPGGWGTALKPAHEPIVVARKPISERSIAANVIEHGTGGLNIDGCRIAGDGSHMRTSDPVRKQHDLAGGDRDTAGAGMFAEGSTFVPTNHPAGRWPANVMLTHSADCRSLELEVPGVALDPPTWECVEGCPVAALDAKSGGRSTTGGTAGFQDGGMVGGVGVKKVPRVGYEDKGGASRFFSVTAWEPEFDTHTLYHPKASRSERKGLAQGTHDNSHPTVKPVALMQQLVRLVTPPDGLVLDPFCGSGSTGVAAIREGFKFLGMEQDPEYVEIARRRLTGDFPLVSREVPIDSIIAGE